MPRRPSLRAQIEALLEVWQPEVRRAFLASIDDLRSNADLRSVVAALERNDIEAAIRALNIDPAAFRPVERALAGAFEAGGTTAATAIAAQAGRQGVRGVVFRFDGRDPWAENFLRGSSLTRITTVLAESELASARMALSAGMQAGINPRSMALDLVGRLDRRTGRRTGGIIGLSGPQTDQAISVRAILSNPDRIRSYFVVDRDTGARSPRYKMTPRGQDALVWKAIQGGRALTPSEVERIAMAHKNNMLRLRGETIARTEAKGALHQSELAAFQNAAETAGVDRRDIRRTWRHSGGRNPRDQHVNMTGQTVGLDEPFVAPDGTRLMYPCDPEAPVSHTASCRCQVETVIDFLGALAREEAEAA